MDQASWVPVAVDPLVPPARLAALLVERRTNSGLDLAAMAERSGGMFTPTFLENAERGRIALDDRMVEHLVGLYEVDSGPVIPQRSELVLDLDRQEISVGDRAVPIDSLHTDDVLERYITLIYLLRGAEPGTDLTLRDADLEILGEALGATTAEVRAELTTLIAAPDSVQRAKSVSNRKIVAAAGILVAITAIGTLVLVDTGNDSGSDSATEVLGASELPVVTTGFPSEVGAAAIASVGYDYTPLLPGWQIRFADDHPDFLGITLSTDKTITVHVEPDATVDAVAAVLMHEVGHAIDLEHMDNDQRAEWIALRDMPATWWPGNGLSDFAVGAGDFAEAVAAYTTGSASSSVYGEFTDEQLSFVADILDAS